LDAINIYLRRAVTIIRSDSDLRLPRLVYVSQAPQAHLTTVNYSLSTCSWVRRLVSSKSANLCFIYSLIKLFLHSWLHIFQPKSYFYM